MSIIIRKNLFKLLSNIQIECVRHHRVISMPDPMPYTTAIWRKRFPYRNKTQFEVTHDEVYTKDMQYKTLEERRQEFDPEPIRVDKVNIGILSPINNVSKAEVRRRFKHYSIQRNRADLKKLHYDGALRIPLDEVHDDWLSSQEFSDNLHMIANHYGIFDDLFKHGHFIPRIPLHVNYPYNNDQVTPVYSGNRLYAKDASEKPQIEWKSTNKENEFYTLIFTNLDGHLKEDNAEVLHWFVGNIPGNQIDKGETLCSYLPPFPPNGSGWHRCVFLLYKHENGPINYSEVYGSLPGNSVSLEKRTFRTFDFFNKLCSQLRPISLAFFQVTWDASVKDIFHNVLGMKEPRYEFDFEPRYLPPQQYSVERAPFNNYLEQYRDRKDVNEQVIKHYLSMTCPFNGYPNIPKYPLAVPNEKWVPDWYKFELVKYHKRQGKWQMMPF
ncbi:unnamed protein product [Adineta steineri]|uniref:Large ribosomal subunit protein mL38 n=1 Tax=Adineta steineri TaxID=433720 RepID=A0A818WP67_9BILA|nr:unnamed protein product [Adineta steineri]